jgi:hypothetical protein
VIRSCQFPLYQCEQPSILRVKVYGIDGTSEYDLCRPHVHVAAGEFPDNITTEREYPLSAFNQSGDGMDEVQAVFTRSEIFELMGECALPPFRDHPEASSWDCAPMAEDIIKVVDRIFASKLPGTRAPGRRVKDIPQA